MQFLVVGLLILLGLDPTYPYEQQLTLYDSYDDTGNSWTYKTHVSDSSDLAPSIKRYCLHGMWIFYLDANFGTNGDHFYSYDAAVICLNASFPINSFRFGGEPSTEVGGVSLYSGFNFEGEETKVVGDSLADCNAKSFVITGLDIWTFYSEPNFQGRLECRQALPTSNITYRMIPPTPWTEMRSVIKGCPFSL